VSEWPDISISPEIVDRAVFAHQAIPIHAHEQPARAADQLYQEFGGLLRRMDSSEWQLIYGGRGTGKTALMRTYAERSRRGGLAHRPEDRLLSTLAVYLDAQQFRPPPLKVDARERARASFRLFLARFGDELVRTATALEARQSIYARLRPRGGRAQNQASRIVREILAVVDQAEPLWPYDAESISAQDVDRTEAVNKADVGGDIALDVAKGQLDASLRGGVARAREHSRSSTTTRTRSGQAYPDLPRILDLLSQFCTELEIERVDILIDDWSAVDGDGTGAVQPYLADMIRAALRGSEHVSVKIATDGLQTHLWDRTSTCGLNLGDDITLLENLNHALLEDDELVRFFERLLFRRMLKDTEQMRQFLDPHTPGAPLSPRFIESLFESTEAFRLLVHGSEGRARQFLHAVRDLAYLSNFSVQPPWSREQVLEVVARRGRPELEDMEYYSPAVRFLLAEIKPAVIGRNNRRFTASDAYATERREELDELLAKRLIEQPEVLIRRRAEAHSLAVYDISRDLLREWERARRFQQNLAEAQKGEAAREPSLDDLRIDPPLRQGSIEGGDADG